MGSGRKLLMILRPFLATVLVSLAVGLTAVAPYAAGDAEPSQHVTLIGDSVATALAWVPAGDIVRQGADVGLELAACRRTEEDSCDVGAGRPTTVVQLAKSMGAGLGPIVLVAVGYNDYEDDFARNVEDALDAFKKAGVKRVVWLNLREAHHPYITMNDDLMAAAGRHPELTILDWNQYSRSHEDWFQADGLHLVPDGAIAYATFIHSALVTLGAVVTPTTTTAPTTGSKPPQPARASSVKIVTSKLPKALRAKPYKAHLLATGGRPPYRWRHITVLPKGIVLATDGLIAGIPRNLGTFVLSVAVADASGRHALRRVTLRVGS